MIGHWIAFSLLLPIIFFGCFACLSYTWKKSPPNEKQKRLSSINCIKYIAFYWLCDLFYMACFNYWLIWKFVFGCLILIFVFVNLAKAFIVPKTRSILETIGLLQDFLVGIGLTVYLLYIIPNQTLQDILIPIISAVYGGLLTLVGVGLTIRKSDKDRKDDETKKAEPIFSFNMLYSEPHANDFGKVCLCSSERSKHYQCEASVVIENSINSAFEMKWIYHDGKKHTLEGNTRRIPASPNDKCLLSFLFSSPNDIFLAIEDSLGFNRFYEMKVLLITSIQQPVGGIWKHTVREIKKIDVNTLPKETREALLCQ